MDKEVHKELLERVERLTELPLMVLALAMVPLLLGPIFFQLSPAVEQVFLALDWFIWSAFALDLALRTYLAESRLQYLRRHWLDVLIVLLPLLRPLRIVRTARLLRLLYLLRLGVFVSRAAVAARRALQVQYVLLFGLMLILVCASLVTIFESEAGGTITSFADAIWWAVVTITTVGYGDTYPITPEGRGVAFVLMIGGIAFFSAITANVAALILGGQREYDASRIDELLRRIDELEKMLRENLKQKV